MDRWACIEAFQFPLQLLLVDRPHWREEPVAVIDGDGPRGRLTYLNKQARQARLDKGMRYREAVALVPQLRAETVDADVIDKHSQKLGETLTDIAPRIERHDRSPGLFWLDVTGLQSLYDSWQHWANSLQERIEQQHGLYVAVVIGFSRFGTYAVIRATRRSGVFETPQSERDAAGEVALSKLDIQHSTLETMHRLDIRSVDDLVDLPAEGLRRRLGDDIYALYRQATGGLQQPHQTVHSEQQASHTDRLDTPETNRERLLFLIKRNLQNLVDTLQQGGEKVTALSLVLHRRSDEPIRLNIRPAKATGDTGLMAELIRIKLDNLQLTSAVTDVTIKAEGQQTTTEQMQLLVDTPTRDIDAANRALARLRTAFGPDAITQVVPKKGHLPESRFRLRPLDTLELPSVDATAGRRAIRRFFPTPVQLSGQPRASLDTGPHTICGGWWVRPVHRDYHLVSMDNQLQWVFFDHHRQRWYLHGNF